MEEIQPVEMTEEITEEMAKEVTGKVNNEVEEQLDEVEERQPIPFGEDGASFLRNVTQHAVFLGLVALILMIIRIFGQQ